MPTDLQSYTYTPSPNTRGPVKQTPLDQTKRRPSTDGSYGKIPTEAPLTRFKGGKMQSGGMRRPKRPRI